jgi:hypothetical protein
MAPNGIVIVPYSIQDIHLETAKNDKGANTW